MANLGAGGQVPDAEANLQANPQANPLAGRYVAVLGPMFGGSLPASAAVYNMIRDSADHVKFLVFGGITFGVFAVASGLVATALGAGEKSAAFARVATLLAVTVVLTIFTAALCISFELARYKVGCGVFFGLLICALDGLWIYFKW